MVEDTELSRDLLVQILEETYEVVTASDGAEGVEVASREHPDVVLMDLSLPVLDGWEATRLIKDELASKTRVIAVTAHAMPGDEERARAAGADDFITKPVDEDILLEKLHRHLGADRR